MEEIITHHTKLQDRDLLLRPLVAEDFPLLFRWNSDREVLYFSEGADAEPYTEADIAHIYSTVAASGLCFIVEIEGRPIGECWLRSMKTPFSGGLAAFSDCRRIDLMIGEKEFWGKGYGTRIIGLLCAFAFENTSCSHVFSGSIFDYNQRSIRAFEKNGFRLFKTVECGTGLVQKVFFKGKLNKTF